MLNKLIIYFSTSREYLLWLAPDLYSMRHTQWYYFRIRGMVAKEPYTFHIVNFLKPDSLYNHGECIIILVRYNKYYVFGFQECSLCCTPRNLCRRDKVDGLE